MILLQLADWVLPQYCRMSDDTYSRLLFSNMILHDNLSPHKIIRKMIVPGLTALVMRSRNESHRHKQLVEIVDTPEPKPQNTCPENANKLTLLTGAIYLDGLGHSLLGMLEAIVIATLYGCKTYTAPHYSMSRNFIFSPARLLSCAHSNGSTMQGDLLRAAKWIYCHQVDNMESNRQSILDVSAENYTKHMRCFPMVSDPWRAMCGAASSCMEARVLLDRLGADDNLLQSRTPITVLSLGNRGTVRWKNWVLNRTDTRSRARTHAMSASTAYQDALWQTRRQLSTRFWLRYFRHRPSAKRRCGFEPGHVHIVSHVRRGDIMRGDRTDRARIMGMPYYTRWMNTIATALEDRGARVQLFVHSETDQPPAVGVPSTLSEFSGTVFTGRVVRSSATNALHEAWVGRNDGRRRVLFSLDSNPMETLFCLSKASVLLLAQSSLSTLASFLSTGVHVIPDTEEHFYLFRDALCRLLACNRFSNAKHGLVFNNKIIRASQLPERASSIYDNLHKPPDFMSPPRG